MEADPSLDALDLLIDELEDVDPEHPDISVSHETGWSLSAFPSGRLIFENVEVPEEAPRQMVGDRHVLKELLRALAVGDLDRLESEAWSPYGR